jgi:formiminotetrahydrofolate cyclodeaminase
MDRLEVDTALSRLSLKHFIEQTNQERPAITGGCVLLTNSSLTAAMILMALKVSNKKSKDVVAKRFLNKKIRTITSLQSELLLAAESDLHLFDQYRATLKSKAKNRPVKLIESLKIATRSLVAAADLVSLAIKQAQASLPYVDVTVASDVDAGILLLEATHEGLLIMAESNQQALEDKH